MDISKLSELLAALAKLLWPIAAVVLLLVFRKDVSSVLRRLRKGRLLGQELELDEEVAEFRKTVNRAQREIPSSTAGQEQYQEEQVELDRDEREVIDASRANPQLGIIKLSSILEKEIRQLAGSSGQFDRRTRASAPQLMRLLIEKGYLPGHANQSLEMFWNLRNQVVHGDTNIETNTMLRILDVGLVLLRTLKAVPRTINVVYDTGVELFLDPAGSIPIETGKGLLLEAISPGKVEKTFQIFPTRNAGYYKKGKRVTWEWDLTHTWDAAWYYDKSKGKIVKAWDQAGEFTGRHMDEIDA